MDRSEALWVIEESLSRPSSTPCTWREDRDAYIEEEKQALLESLIEPCLVKVIASQWAQEQCGHSGEVREMIALANSGTSWLLFDQTTKEFALAFSPNIEGQPFGLLGFSSDDALAEWLG